MGRLLRNFALMSVLMLGGVVAGCQPEQKECHCTGANCNCPLPPAKKPAASDSGEDKSDAAKVAQHHKRHRVHTAHHEKQHRVHLARGSHTQTRSAATAHGHAHRMAATFSHRHASRIAFTRGHAATPSTHRGGHASHSTRHAETRLPETGMDGAVERTRHHLHHHGSGHAAWSDRYRQAREYREGEESSSSSGLTRRHAYAPLPYNYHSRSRAYASPQEGTHVEGGRAERGPRNGERHEEYSEREMRRENRRGRHREDPYQGETYGPDYDAGVPEEAGPPPARSGGAAGHWMMSINAPEALDSWHGYSVDCPDWDRGL